MDSAPTLGAIVRAKAGELLASQSLSPHQLRTFRAIADCRTPALGGHRNRCASCGHEQTQWNSCRNRHCPLCGAAARAAWVEARRSEVLPTPYFHAAFTIPEELNGLAIHAPAVVYAILLRAAGRALIDVGQTKLRATLGVTAMLHTWGQQLPFHPHVHCVVTGGGFSLDGARWVRVRKLSFLLAVKVISRRFRSLVTTAIREALASGEMTLPPSIPDAPALEQLLCLSCRTDWHAYVKKPFGGPDQVLAYLSSYTHRIAISNRRILAFDGKSVTFTWHDYANHYAARTATLTATEFLRRFAMHIVPSRFVRIRYFGFLANRLRHHNIELARNMIASKLRPRDPRPAPQRLCPECGTGVMSIIARVAPYIPRTWFDSS
ncbi:MAG: IS91 family transposase [Thermoanaerobaculia bacterium]